MPTFHVFHAVYDPDNYTGHRYTVIATEDIKSAEKQVQDRIRKFAGKGKWEYMIFPTSPDCIGPKLINTKIEDTEKD